MIGVVRILSGAVPQFGLLCDILLYGKEPCVIFVFTLMETVKYNGKLGAYELIPLAEYKCFYRSAIQCYHPFNPIHINNSTTTFIKSKYDLTVYCYYN